MVWQFKCMEMLTGSCNLLCSDRLRHLLLYGTTKVIFCRNGSVNFIVNLCSFPSKKPFISELAKVWRQQSAARVLKIFLRASPPVAVIFWLPQVILPSYTAEMDKAYVNCKSLQFLYLSAQFIYPKIKLHMAFVSIISPKNAVGGAPRAEKFLRAPTASVTPLLRPWLSS